MSYIIESSTNDCYEGTTCLINKFDIRDEEKLSELEADITFAKASILEAIPNSTSFDINHYKAIHKFLFEDLYEWAGEFRTVEISKKGTDFCSVKELERVASNCFERLKEKNFFQNLKKKDFIEEIVDLYCVTNMLHPFREGNGRTQRIFITHLIRYNGYDFNFSSIDSDFLMLATIQAANGVTDYLKQIFCENIK